MILEQTAVRQAKLLAILRQEFGLSSGLVKRLKWQNALFVNGLAAHTDACVRPGDCVRVVIRESPEGFDPEPMALSVLYEDEAFLAVDKPPGMLVHPSPQRNSGTLANGVLYYLQQNGEDAGIHPVTRLDRDTFGVVLLAKNANIHDRFCRMLCEKRLQKTYLAAVFGAPADGEGQIDLPVYKPGGGSLIRTVDARGQEAHTRYRVLFRADDAAVLALQPLTGRTHQLRLHCLSAGFPILGDPQYTTPAAKAYSDARGLFTQQLCAAKLEFRHPMTDEPVTICTKQRIFLPEGLGKTPVI